MNAPPLPDAGASRKALACPPRWLTAMAWIALAGSLLPRLFPRQEAIPNAAGALAVLAALALGWSAPLRRRHPWVVAGAAAFLASGLVSALVRHGPPGGDAALLGTCIHAWWNTVQAAAAAALTLHLAADPANRRTLLSLVTACLFVLFGWMLLRAGLLGAGPRLGGVKANDNVTATLFLVAGFSFWPFVLSGTALSGLGRRLGRAGFLLVLLAAYLLQRKGLGEREVLLQAETTFDLRILLFGIPLLAALSAWGGWARGGRTRQGLAMAGIALNGLILAFVGSRSALAAWLATTTALVLVTSGRYRRKALAVLAAGILVLAPVIFARFGSDPGALFRSGGGLRLHIWRISLRVAAEHPLFGSGPGSPAFRRAWRAAKQSSDEAQRFPDYRVSDHAHQQVLHILASQGAIGFAAFAFLLLALARVYVRGLAGARETDSASISRSRLRTFWGVFGLTVLAALLLNGLFELPLQESPEIFFWFFAALAVAAVNAPGGETPASPAGTS